MPDSTDRRSAILDAAVEVFGRQGFHRGSLREVARVVGLTTQGVLHYFPTKEQLLLAVLQHRTSGRAADRLDTGIEHGAVAVLRSALADNLAQPGHMALFVVLAAEATDPDHPAHGYFARRYRETHDGLTELVAADIARGRVSGAPDPAAVADSLIALADGLQLQKLLRPEFDLLNAYDQATAAWLAPATT